MKYRASNLDLRVSISEFQSCRQDWLLQRLKLQYRTDICLSLAK